MRGEISRHDLKFKAKLCLEFVCAQIIPSKNDQMVHNEADIFISFLMTGVHINYQR